MYRFAAPIIYLHTTAHPSSLPTRIQYAHCSCMYALDIKVKEPDFEAMKRNEIKYHRFLFTLAPKYASRMHSFHTYSHSCAHLHAVYPCKPCIHILYAHKHLCGVAGFCRHVSCPPTAPLNSCWKWKKSDNREVHPHPHMSTLIPRRCRMWSTINYIVNYSILRCMHDFSSIRGKHFPLYVFFTRIS